ncbi:hypothetical protein HK100_007854 [Physocladia obscura]|uniref:Uncharacterized protein n=1 Tax=Physocladia obscura TaxID=109957 RepID=A0AAD5SQB3_9FUNG|nr:hypothetical protein HK100_007854 [Physocladia obscura]
MSDLNWCLCGKATSGNAMYCSKACLMSESGSGLNLHAMFASPTFTTAKSIPITISTTASATESTYPGPHSAVPPLADHSRRVSLSGGARLQPLLSSVASPSSTPPLLATTISNANQSNAAQRSRDRGPGQRASVDVLALVAHAKRPLAPADNTSGSLPACLTSFESLDLRDHYAALAFTSRKRPNCASPP